MRYFTATASLIAVLGTATLGRADLALGYATAASTTKPTLSASALAWK